MKRNNILIVIAFIAFSPLVFAQDQAEEQPAVKKNERIKGTFECQSVINNQTIESASKNSLDFMIQHRFGIIKDEKDLFGLFAPSNIRLGLGYGIIKGLSVGLGVTKNKRLYDLEVKYQFLKQTKPGGMPVTVTYYGDFARSAAPKENFMNQENKYVSANRFSYFHELMVARKWNNRLSLQIAATYTHLNIIDTLMKHDHIGISFVGRYKFSPQSSALLEFDYPLTKPEVNAPKPNLGIGYEVSTGSHQFQIFICTADAILNQETRMFNQNDFAKQEILIGFNITRQWGF